jgi:hypothetical protein
LWVEFSVCVAGPSRKRKTSVNSDQEGRGVRRDSYRQFPEGQASILRSCAQWRRSRARGARR